MKDHKMSSQTRVGGVFALFAALSLLALAGCENALIDRVKVARAQQESPVIQVLDPTQKALVAGGTLTFPDTSVGGQVPLTLTITNSGPTPLVLDPTASKITTVSGEAGSYALGALPVSIAAGASAKLVVTFLPVTVGPKSATVDLLSNDLSRPKITFTVAGKGLATAKELLSFNIPNVETTVVVTGTSIAVTVPYSSSLTGLVAKFSSSGVSVTVNGSVQTSETTTNDFTNPVVYVVVAADGSTKNFTVTLTRRPPLPVLSTAAVTTIATTTATCGGTITGDGGLVVSERGVCWSTSPNPTTDDAKLADGGTGIGSFTQTITGLSPGQFYYVRAYATNALGKAYGAMGAGYGPQVSFTTIPPSPLGLTASPGNHQITLTWNRATSATSYKVYCATTSPVTISGTTLLAVSSGTTFTKVGLPNNTMVYYVVTSVGASGESGASSPASATPSQVVAYITSLSGYNSGVGLQAFTVGRDGTLTKIASSSVFDAGTGADAITVDPLGRFAFVSNRYGTNQGKIYTYLIDGTTGAPSTGAGYINQTSHINVGPPPFRTAGNIAVDPTGKYAYVLNSLGSVPGWVDAYTIDSVSGNLTLNGPALTTGGLYGQVDGIAVDPTGKFVYTASNNYGGYDGTIAGFAINPSGALTPTAWVSLTTSGWPGSSAIGFAPNGNFYVSEATWNGQVEAFTRPLASGLPQTNGRYLPFGQNCSLLAVDPLGRFVYSGSTSGRCVTGFKTLSNGTLGPALGPYPVAGIQDLEVLSCEPTGRFLYLVTRGNAPYPGSVLIYTIDQSTGALSLSATDTSIGNSPTAMAFGSLP